MAEYALLGRKLGHSFSPRIHRLLCGYDYTLQEVEREELPDFLKNCGLKGMNVTIPYKKEVLPYCSQLSEGVRRIGSANTLVRGADGWHAYNTDYLGFRFMVESGGFSPAGKKAVVLGNGGASLAVCTALEDMGAREISVISRRGENNYENLFLHRDAEMLVNATPVGMYPDTGKAAAGLDAFPECRAVFDLIYNPARTKLIMEAEERGLICRSGLTMLVAQARRSAELFTGQEIPPERVDEIVKTLSLETENIILIGMPGCGKSSIGAELARLTGRKFADADSCFLEKYGISPGDMIESQGEAAFRQKETELLAELGKESGLILSTGGGCVTEERNYPLLHQNGRIFWIQRDIGKLPSEGRPLSRKSSPEEMYKKRAPMYRRFADYTIVNDGSISEAAAAILELLK